jgi:malate permease and related proteins
MILTKLLQIYLPLVSGVTIGWAIRPRLPPQTPFYLGKFLFWLGVPIGVFVFLRRTQWVGAIGWAGALAWVAIGIGGTLMAVWLQFSATVPWAKPTRGTALLAAMFGNTGYVGFPIILTLFGEAGFAWALFYDLLGTTLGAYGLGTVIASRYGASTDRPGVMLKKALVNPTIAAFGLALWYRDPLPGWLDAGLDAIAWGSIGLALLLIGMRLRQLKSRQQLRPALWPIGLKMLLVPLLMWAITAQLPLPPIAKQVIVLQSAMPPAFATVVLTENYKLDPEFAVAVVAGGTIGLLFTLPIWLWLIGAL